MNKNTLLSTISVIVISIASLSACTIGSGNIPLDSTAKTMPATQHPINSHTIKFVNSSAIVFSKVRSSHQNGNHVVTGNTKLKIGKRRILKLPGYIQVSLKSGSGTTLERVKAKFHRKYGSSTAGHFDATLKMTPPNGSQILVEHINN